MQRPTQAAARRAEDAALAVRFMARPEETAVLEAAWRRFGPLVRRTLVRMLGPDEEVHDLSQEAFLQLYRSVRALRSPESIRPFITGLAIRVGLGEIRRRRVRGGHVLVPGQGLVPLGTTSADPEAREAMAGLLGLVDRLRTADREMFTLRHVHGLGHTEICELTRLSMSTVRRRLQRLQRRLGILLQGSPALAVYAERASSRSGRSVDDDEADAE